MKKFVLLLAPILLALVACNSPAPSSEQPSSTPNSSSEPSSIPSSSEPSSTPSSSEDMWGKDVIKVYFFESGVKFNRAEPYFLTEYEVESKISKPADPVSSDPAFNVFLGWSSKPHIMEDEDLWDFENDALPRYVAGGEFYLYGQWDYVG